MEKPGEKDNLKALLLTGSQESVRSYVEDLLAKGLSTEEIAQSHLVPAVLNLGELFTRHEIFIPEMLLAARAVNAGLQVLKSTAKTEKNPEGIVVLGTVKGDLHDIGKNIVMMMLEGSGYKVLDLGVDVPAEKFIHTAREHHANIIGMSALLTSTMTEMKRNIAAIDGEGLRPAVRVVVGGAPVTEAYARSIGADGFAPDAFQAVAIIRKLMGKG
jgi:5-methyltetrahydrofolate--homocysteine methyltransferase